MFHPSRLFSLVLSSFILACAIFSVCPGAPYVLIIVAALFTATLILFIWNRSYGITVMLILLATAISFMRLGVMTPSISNDWWGGYYGQTVSDPFIVISDAKVTGKNQTFLVTSWSGMPKGSLEVITNQVPIRKVGEVVRLTGELEPISAQSSFSRANQVVGRLKYPDIVVMPRVYSSKLQGVYYSTRQRLTGIRDSYLLTTGKILPEPQSGLLSGILFGVKADLSAYWLSILAITGTVHIIALSGYNITIVADSMRRFSKGYNRNIAFFVPVIGVLAFVLATGLSASVVRAAIMGITLLLASRLGRQPDSLNAVLLASALMALVNPYIVIFDVGFQLSFAAVVGIIFLEPVLEPLFKRLGPTLAPIVAGTLAAQIYTWPLLAYYFARISLVGVLANTLILPIIPLVMGVGFTTVSIGFFFLDLARILSPIIWFMLSYILKVTEFFANLPVSSVIHNGIGPWFLAGYYILIVELTIFWNLRRRRRV